MEDKIEEKHGLRSITKEKEWQITCQREHCKIINHEDKCLVVHYHAAEEPFATFESGQYNDKIPEQEITGTEIDIFTLHFYKNNAVESILSVAISFKIQEDRYILNSMGHETVAFKKGVLNDTITDAVSNILFYFKATGHGPDEHSLQSADGSREYLSYSIESEGHTIPIMKRVDPGSTDETCYFIIEMGNGDK